MKSSELFQCKIVVTEHHIPLDVESHGDFTFKKTHVLSKVYFNLKLSVVEGELER